ncbi:Outer membrane protein OprJ [compost metagenome]
MRNSIFTVTALAFSLALGGCSLAPTFERPEAPVAQAWNTASDQSGAEVGGLNWQSFIIDAELRRLVGIALDNNRSLRQTLLDIEQARAQYRIQRADRVPGLGAGASGDRQRLPADLSSTGVRDVTSSYQVGLALPE